MNEQKSSKIINIGVFIFIGYMFVYCEHTIIMNISIVRSSAKLAKNSNTKSIEQKAKKKDKKLVQTKGSTQTIDSGEIDP